ncbi:MAG: hypothetical protein OEL80_00615 [Desulfuromonadales bacterium]|jgi:hypothetical protein|nr:hypothetical protein [Desulfuromonadales bacterium]
METDWSKVFEVFGSGIVGVFLVMFLLQVLTQFSTRVIDVVENLGNGKGSAPGADTPAPATKD